VFLDCIPVFNAVKGVIYDEKKQYNCSCVKDDTNKDTFAYVYPDRSFIYYLCRVFFASKVKGFNSQGGTFIHETTHFTVVAGTEDNAYGEDACEQLAKESPEKAVQNADSNEFFAENDEPVPIEPTTTVPVTTEPVPI